MTMTHPLSQSQTGIYLTCMNTGGDVNYNMDFLYELTDDIDLQRLAAALDKVIETHPYVKSRLVVTDSGEAAFEDRSAEAFHTPIYDAEDLAEVRGRIGKDYDLMHDRLFRLEIYRTGHGAYLYQGFHHIIFDGISHAAFREDLEKAYAGEALEGEETDGFQIAEREAAARQSAIYGEAKAWYAQEYGGVGETDYLPPSDIFGKEEPQYGKYSEPLNIDRPKTDALCERAGVRESVVFSAAFGITLSKFTCQDEVACVTGFHGRTDKATRRSLTMTVRTLPLRFNLQQTPTVAELLQATAEQTRMTRRYDMYSFVDMSNDLGLNADVSFVYHGSIRGNDLHLNGSTQKVTEILTNTPGFKFVGMLVYKDDVPYFEVEYLSNRYSREFVDSFKRTFETVVNEMCVKESVADIECCDEEGIAQLDRFNTLNKVPQTMPENETIVSLFQRQASLQPDHTAVVFGDKRYTYRELDEQTDRIASLILSTLNSQLSTLTSEPVISIIIHRNEWMVLASLAALKAGCAYQPLDPSYPQDRLNFMVKDANAVLLIADEDLRPIVNEYQGEVLLTKDLLHLPSLTAEANSSLFTLHPSLSPSSLFTLLYTSGSTGVPKGVMLEHRNLIAFNLFFSRYIDVGPASRVAAYASFGFDANMMDIFCTLMSGATLHIIDEDMRLDLEALHRYFEREGITNCFMTTQVGVQYLELYPQSSSLRHLVIAGEKMRAVKLEGLTYHIHNGYGPSETACGCALHEVKHWEPNIPIGTPSDLCNLYIVDGYGHRLPPGAPGELIICGPQVTRGYLNQPEKTAEAFFTFNGQRAYHSGDIVRYRQNGDIEFVGRRDGMVKIRGFRIELGEVEAVIRDYEGVMDVTVQAFDDPNGGKFLAAYVVTDGRPLDIHALNAFIASQKPPYMVPAVTMQIEKIPLTVNQKVDKKSLPSPQVSAATAEGDYVPMKGYLEETIAQCIAETLSIDTAAIGARDTFSMLGGTSIKAIKLNTLLKGKNIEIPMEHLLRQNNVRNLALIADYASRGEYVEKRTALHPAQLRMLHQYLKHPDHPTDAYSVMMDIDSTVTEEVLRRAIDTIAAKHTTITSAIAYVGTDQPQQVYLSGRQVPLYVIDADDEQEAVAKMDDQRMAMINSVCSLQLEPLLQMALCRIGGASAYLIVSCYSIIAEMWKISQWMQELFALLHTECGGENVANWEYILTTSLEAIPPSEREDWSKEQHSGDENWYDEGLTAACDDSIDNYKVLTEKPGGRQLVFVHTGNTGSEAYMALANGLKDFCSFAVLDQWNLYHRDDIKHGIPEIARKYIEVLREHQPHGPYYLGGWCYGGLVAYEMACQLKEMGEQVKELFMFDSHTVRKRVFKDMILNQSGDSIRNYFEQSPLFESLIKRGLIDAMVANSLQVNSDMVHYQPKPYDGEVIYFKAITPAVGLKGRAAEYFEEMNSKRAGGFEKYIRQYKLHIVDIKQEHDNLMNEASLSIEVPYMKQYL